MFELIDALGSGMADAFHKPAEGGNELAMLRGEIAKWQQRVPKITELLRKRSEALAESELQNRQLRKALAEAQETVAQSSSETRTPASGSGRDNPEEVVHTMRLEVSRLQKELGSLQTRNRMLAETVEVLTHQLSRSNADLLVFRRAQHPPPVEVVLQPAAANESGQVPTFLPPPAPALGMPDLLQIHGVGVKIRKRLVDAGINTIETLATLTDLQLDDPAFSLFSLGPRIRRERWVEQARHLLEARTAVEKL